MSVPTFDGNKAFAHLRALAQEIGPRPAGSEGERQAGRYLADRFREIGLDTRVDAFPIARHSQTKSELEALGPSSFRIQCIPQLYAADTPEKGVEGELAFLETADPQYLQEHHRDKVWLILGGLPLSLYGKAMALRPRAIIAVENELWVLPKTSHLRLTYRERYGSVPTVRIAFEDGLRLLKQGVKRVRIETRSEEIPSESCNVIGELPGRGDGEEVAVVCAHLDSVLGVTGAGDNASGVSILIELARVFAARGSRRTLRFAAFGSEEIGLRGSVRYARELALQDKEERARPEFHEAFDRTALARHRLCVNLDMHGVTLGRNRATCMGPADLTAAIRLLAAEMGPAFEAIQEGIFSSDGMSLAAVGVPGVAFARTGGSSVVTHSGADTIEYLDADHLAMTGRFIEIFLRRHVADALLFPFAREIPAAIVQKTREYFRERLVEILPPAEPAPKP